MRILNNLYLTTITIIMIMCSNILPSKIIQQSNNSQIISQAHTKINNWINSLTTEELSFLSPLLETYNDLYADYKSNQSDLVKQELLLHATKITDHIMNNWSSLYNQNIAAQIFNKLFLNWKKLNSKRSTSIQKKVQAYENAYQAYDKNPTNNQLIQSLLKQEQTIKPLLSSN